MLRQPLLFGYWLPKHPVFWFSPLFNIVRSPLATYSSLCSTFVTYSTSCHAIGHNVLPTHPLLRVLRTWENVFYSQAFLPCTPSYCFQGIPGAGSSPSKAAGLHADHRNIALAQVLSGMKEIYKRGIVVGFIYVSKASFKVRVPQPCNLPLTGFKPVFLKVPCVTSHLSWRLDHRALWVLIDR